MNIKEINMTPLTIGLLAFLGGSAVTGGSIWAINKSQQKEQDIEQIITSLETKFEQAQASVVVQLTQPDLLKIPCSMEYINGTFDKDGKQVIKGKGEGLCREMFCRMNRQGGGQNSGGGAGATQQDCSAISDANLSILVVETCLSFYSETNAGDQNSKFQQCKNIFNEKK